MDDDGIAGGGPATVGARLAAARADLGLSLDDVAQRTRIPLRHLAAIESGSGEGLPALTYSSGFVRSFAGAVGLDPNELSRDYRQELDALPPARAAPTPYEAADPARVPPWWLAIAALVIAALLAGGYALWRGDALFGHGETSPAEIATTPLPDGASPPPGARVAVPPVSASGPMAPASGPVVLTATETVWIKITDGERKLFMGTLDAGKSFTVPPGAADPRLRTGRPQALKVTAGGVDQPPIGRPDQILREVSLRPGSLGQGGAPPPPAASSAVATAARSSATPSSAATGPGGNAAAPPPPAPQP